MSIRRAWSTQYTTRECKTTHAFLAHFWALQLCIEALNRVYTQLPDGKITERTMDSAGMLLFVVRKEADFKSYLKGHMYVVWSKVPPKKKPRKDAEQEPSDGAWELQDVAKEWLRSLDRAQCHGATFDPERPPGRNNGFLNMYEGWGIEPKAPASGKLEDAAPLLRDHIRNIICGGDEAHLVFLENCLSQLVRWPWRKLGLVFVLKARQGAGKNTLLDVLRIIFGRHGMELTNARHITGNFNDHLRTRICIILNEAVWGGDKQSEGVLKAAITESTTVFEPKGVDAHEGRNFWTFFISSNEKWCIPATADGRRYFMLAVSNERIGNAAYFTALHKAIEAGEDREYMWYLLNRICPHPDTWKPCHNMPARTPAYVEQMLQDRSNSLLRFLCEQLRESGEWIWPTFASTPIIQKGKHTKVAGSHVLAALKDASQNDPALRAQLGQQAALTDFFKSNLGDNCFNNRARFLQAERPPGHTGSDWCYEFASAEEIMTHLSVTVLQVHGVFE